MSTSTKSDVLSFLAIDEDDAHGVDPTAVASTLVPTGGQANGHVDIFATARQNIVEETYSFTATSKDAFPLAKGQFEGHALRFTGETVNIHAEVTCMSIDGNVAYVGARITRATVDEQEVPNSAGVPLTFRVQDAGNDVTAADAASLWFLASASDIIFCNTRPTTNALRSTIIGNVQVKPE